MSRKSDEARLSRILELIADAEIIAGRHGGVLTSLADTEGEYALLMVVSQIGELLGKIETAQWIEVLPVREASV